MYTYAYQESRWTVVTSDRDSREQAAEGRKGEKVWHFVAFCYIDWGNRQYGGLGEEVDSGGQRTFPLGAVGGKSAICVQSAVYFPQTSAIVIVL
jgi:hypothetical protein